MELFVLMSVICGLGYLIARHNEQGVLDYKKKWRRMLREW